MITRNMSSVVLFFLLLCGEQFLSAQADTQRLLNETSSSSAHVYNKTVHASFKNFYFQFPGEGESYVHIIKGPPQPGKLTNILGKVSVPNGKFISLRTNLFQSLAPSCKDIQSKLTISGAFGYGPTEIFPCDAPVLYHSPWPTAVVRFMSFPTGPQHSVLINITAYKQNARKQLHVTYHTKFSGTIVPYGFDGLNDYSVHSTAQAVLKPPTGHSIMFSFPHFHVRPFQGCLIDMVEFYIIGRKPTLIWSRCGSHQMLPAVEAFNAGFKFQLATLQERGYSGFKIRFSFHGPSEVPQKLKTNDSTAAVFNCSVPFYHKFSQHLHCNLETECVQGEDEASCPYSFGTCQPGFLNAGSKCYKYIKTGKTMTWFDASSLCLEHGLTLASFLNIRQLNDFHENILRFAATPFNVFTGLRTSDPSLPAMYRDVWQGSSGTTAYYVHFDKKVFKPSCVSFALLLRDLSPKKCELLDHMQYIFCEAENPLILNKSSAFTLPTLECTSTITLKEILHFAMCSKGHMTHEFLSCDQASQCRGQIGMTSCVTSTAPDSTESSLEIMMYVCDSQTQTIHYTQVCDHLAQCFDSSDETFCIHQDCAEKQCLNKQCVTVAQWCDGMVHCSDGSDESCPQYVTGSAMSVSSSASWLHVVLFDGHGKYKYIPQGDEFPVCPQTHFLCADHELCLPIYVRCNGVYDCLDHGDEDNCDDVTCVGCYRCRGSSVCIHSDHVCDGVFQCPQQDDELLCQLTCPDNCRCQGLAFVCPRPFPVEDYSELRYLDASQSGLRPHQLFHNHYFIRLSLSSCGLYSLSVLEYRNLKFLDLSYNTLSNLSMDVFSKLSNLNILILSRNPMFSLVAAKPNVLLENVHALDLSHTKLKYFGSEMLYSVRNVKNLNLSHSALMVIGKCGFEYLINIESLDVRGTELKHYPIKMLQSLTSLRVMFSDVSKLCCKEVLPGHFSTQNCHTSPDEMSSCKDLLRSDIYRLFLWITCSVALLGNFLSLFYRLYTHRGKKQNSFNTFITHLNISDFFMGLYLTMVGAADQVYRGTYLWHDVGWKTSSVCKAAGFFSLLSCEMSAFIICFITLDRFLVVHFPFSQVRFGRTSAQIVCGLCWIVSVALAAFPLLPVVLHWEFYSQTNICIPLPVTRRSFKGQSYSFGILIVFNFILFVLIAIGQLFIYMSIGDNFMATDQKNAREATVARRLLTIVTSDFLCWFPIGLLGLLASSDVSIPSDVNVAMAIFALPLNSALNPFLYTFNILMEKRQRASEQRLLRMLQIQYKNTLDKESTVENRGL